MALDDAPFNARSAPPLKADTPETTDAARRLAVPNIRATLGAGLRGVLDLALPPRCPASGVVVARPGGLAPAAWDAIRFLGGPCCHSCGLPFDTPLPEETRCAACDARPPQYDRVRAALAYDDASRSLMLHFKHGDRTDLAPVFARWMGRAGGEILDQADRLVPVPLHRARLWRRRYNQAALLAQELSAVSAVQTDPTLLKRARATPSQGRLSPLARQRNVRGAFLVPDRAKEAVQGRHLVLIDDVFTTGATLDECARVLKRAGAARVDALCLARVLRARF